MEKIQREKRILQAAELARSEGIKIYTIGAGSNGVAPIRLTDPFTGQSVLKSMQVRIDENCSKRFQVEQVVLIFRATSGDGLEEVYAVIDKLEKTEMEQNLYRRRCNEYFGSFYCWV